jgi:hypothetical protein
VNAIEPGFQQVSDVKLHCSESPWSAEKPAQPSFQVHSASHDGLGEAKVGLVDRERLYIGHAHHARPESVLQVR